MAKTSIFHAICALFFVLSSACSNATPEDHEKKWSEDVNYYYQELQKRHIKIYNKVDKSAIDTEIEKLKTEIPTLNEHQIQIRLMGISRMIGDGHTQVAFWERAHHYYPFSLAIIDDEVRVLKTTTEYKHILGTSLFSIDGVPVQRIIEKISPIVQGVDNEHSLKSKIGWHIGQSEILYGLGIAKKLGAATFQFKNENGEISELDARALTMHDAHSLMNAQLIKKRIPFEKKELTQSESLWVSTDSTSKTSYIYFSAYPSFSEMDKFSSKVKDHLEKNIIKNLIIDLRNNGGGDFFVGLRLAHQLVLIDTIDWDHGVYVLTGGGTFSAGMSNAAQFRQMLNAKIVGEPTGGNPVGYQDMDQFSLPHSKWVITYSKRKYRFQDTYSVGIQPDIPIKLKWNNYKQGDDQALAWIINDIKSRSR